MKRFLSALAAVLVALTACEEVEIPANITIPDANSLELFNTGITFSATKEGGVQTVSLSFETTYKWSVVIEDMTGDWLTVDPNSGEGGPATITVTAKDNTSTEPRSAKVTVSCGGFSKSVNVTQEGMASPQTIPAESVELNMLTAELKVGETLQLVATVKPDNSTDKVEWASLMEENASVKDGLVTALKEGYASITATAGKAIATCRISIKAATVEVTSIELNKTSLELEPDKTEQLIATVKPEDATDKTVTWSTSNEKIATVKEGNVTAKNVGEAIITASAGGKTAECKVTVKKPVVEVQSVTLDKTSVQIYTGQSCQLTATVNPDNATDKTVTWQSSNTAVVTVDNNGLVQTISAGNAKITAAAGSANAECAFEVVAQTYAEPEAVDLGLGVKWGSFNLGATKPEEEGYYFAWGETEPRLGYFYLSDYKFYVNGQYTKYGSIANVGVVDNLTQLEPEDDAAHVKLGNGWRMPTQEECNALKDLDWVQAEQNGVSGFRVTGKNGNTVFFPCTGSIFEDVVYEPDISFSCWNSTRKSNSTVQTYTLNIMARSNDTSKWIQVSGTISTYRYSGETIRPVKD